MEGSRLDDLDLGTGYGTSQPLRQRFDIKALDALWVPGAFVPEAVATNGPTIRADRRSQTLIVDTDRDTSDGLEYTLISDVPAFSADQLRRPSRSSGFDGYIERTYTVLPADFSRQAEEIAEELTATATSDYDRALALQTYFRDGFTYSLEVDAGHDEGAIDSFLESREGYCEQFAGTFAAMARHIGLPSRVAVGFTPGDQDPDDPRLYRVKGKHAHAWPEVWLPNAGWVAFEPTPGRGAPDAEGWTGVAAQQDAADPVTPTTTPTTVPGTEAAPSTLPLSGDALEDVQTRGGDLPGDATPADNRRRVAIGVMLGLVALAMLAWVAIVIVAPAVRRRRRAHRAHTNAARIAVQWIDAVAAVTTITGTEPRAYETHTEFAHRVAPLLADDAEGLDDLARISAAASWSDTEPPDDEVERAQAVQAALHRYARTEVPLHRRLRRRLSLRRALGRPVADAAADGTPAPSLMDRWRTLRGRTTS